MITILFFVLTPILSIFITFFFYLFDKNKKGILYSLLIGISVGIIFYHFIPPHTYDLYRHHLKVLNFYNYDINDFIEFCKNSKTEFLPLLICYIAAIFKNINIIQLFIVSLGYFIILYILYDYRKLQQCNTIYFLFILMFIIFGFNIIYFISGLWFYIAAIFFSLSFYLEYIKNCNKKTIILLYIISLLFHNTMIFPLLLLIIYKLFKNKINIKLLILSFILFFLSSYILDLLNSVLHFKLFEILLNMYNGYIKDNNNLKYLYDNAVFYIEITKLLTIIISVILQNKRNKNDGINGFIILLSVCTLLMMSKSIVMIRFIMIIQFLSIVPLIDVFKTRKKNNIIIILLLITFSSTYIYYSYHMLKYQNFGNLKEIFTENIFRVFNK